MASKLDSYAIFCLDWANDSHNLTLPDIINIVSRNHFPRNLRQYAANEIMLRTTALQYGVTP